jgi:NADPH-dependent 2,4-dienoyl-CoA reductase/sulfur reductase-like enzyme
VIYHALLFDPAMQGVLMQPKRVVIIGAVALGPKVACRLKRLRPDYEVTMVDQGEYISYGGCGIPYYISGDLSDIKELMSTNAVNLQGGVAALKKSGLLEVGEPEAKE